MSVENNDNLQPGNENKEEAEAGSEEKVSEEVLSGKIVTYYGYLGEYSLKGIAKTCAKLVISDCYRDLCFDNFEFPSEDEMRELVLEEMRQHFDEKVVPLIEQTYPDFTDEELDAEIGRLEKRYEKEHKEQLSSTVYTAMKELRLRVRGLQKELKSLKRKYTI